MTIARKLGQNALVLALLAMSACVVEPQENFYDRGHHRYYHEHAWHDCGDGDYRCR